MVDKERKVVLVVVVFIIDVSRAKQNNFVGIIGGHRDISTG